MPSPMRSARPWRPRAGPRRSTSCSPRSTELTPADLQRVAAKYFQPKNETAIILETEIKK